MKQKLIVSALILVVIVVAKWMFWSNRHADASATVTVSQGAIVDKVTAVGSIMPRNMVAVKSSINGTVAKLHCDEGDFVKKGDLLLEIKPRPTPSEYADARQLVAMEKAKEAQKTIDVKRYAYLFQRGALAANDQNYSVAKSELEQARLQRGLAEQKLALLEEGKAVINGQNIGNTVLSPIDGYILHRDVNVGDPVVAQSNAQVGYVLLTIADMNDLVFKGQVSQVDAAKLHTGMKTELNIAALPKTKISATLTKLALQSAQEAENQTEKTLSTNKSPFHVGFMVEIGELKLPPNLKLKVGYSATADIVVQRKEQIALLPERVIFFDEEKAYCWVDVPGKPPRKQPIEIGLTDGLSAEICKGLKQGEVVLAEPPEDQNTASSEPKKKRRIKVR